MIDIDSLAKLGRIEKDIEVNKDLKIKVHTLSASEQQEALSSIPSGDVSEFTKISHLSHAVLVLATDEVNGEKVSQEEASKLYKAMQASLVSDIFTEQQLLSKDQDKVLEALKKK